MLPARFVALFVFRLLATTCWHRLSESLDPQTPSPLLRLQDGDTRWDGRLEILHNKQWGTICDTQWSLQDADVACRQLGFMLAVDVRVSSFYGGGEGMVWLDRVGCSGEEVEVMQCNHSDWGMVSEACRNHSSDAGVVCADNAQALSVRLVGGRSPSEGRVEVFFGDSWGTVCDDGWSITEAAVVCRQLGYDRAVDVFSGGAFGMGSGAIWLDNVQCTGEEEELWQCSHEGWGVHNCDHSEDASVRCADNSSLRLVGGRSESEGRVEILHAGRWGTFCATQFDNHEAQVICRQLGYMGGVVSPYLQFGEGGLGPTWLDSLQCSGNESNITQCEGAEFRDYHCNHLQDVGVVCQDPNISPPNVTVRLAGSLVRYAGRVEVYTLGYWGTVCDDSFDLTDANVVCRELGYSGALAVSFFGQGGGVISLDDVECEGDERSILQCPHNGLFNHNCIHSEDVGVVCNVGAPDNTTHEIRLAGGNSPGEGRVEIRYDGEWGTICDTGWGIRDAQVTCRQLGYSHATDALHNAHFGEGSGPVHIALVRCRGNESELAFCPKLPLSRFQYCNHGDHDASVRCSNSPPAVGFGLLRLTGGVLEREGHLEVYYNETWAPVCALAFGMTEANVSCNQLGYNGAVSLRAISQSNSFAWISAVDCYGDEGRLVECDYWGWGVPCDAVVTLECTDPTVPTQCDLRLAEAQYRWEGTVEIFTNGQWGRVCSDAWDMDDAHVTCRKLGYVGALDAPEIWSLSYRRELIRLSNVQCNGTEGSLCDCVSSGISNPAPCPAYEAGAVCQAEIIPFAVRLVGGAVLWEGRVEVRVNDVWGTICSTSVNTVAASVICRELGYTRALEISFSSSSYGAGPGPQWLDFIMCTGSEQSIFNCSHGGIGQSFACGHAFDLGVVCEAEVINRSVPIRLVDGATMYEGRVEVLYNGIWGTVCDDGWTLADAHVACRQLGFGPALAVLSFGLGMGTIWLDEVGCTGTETVISECDHSGWAIHDCSHLEDAGVRCSELTSHPFDVRLAGGSLPGTGRVEIFYGGVWGTVCDMLWDITDAHVVCKQLGYVGATLAVSPAVNGEGVIWMDQVSCYGNETRLADCNFSGWGVSRCNHTHDAGVICETTLKMGTVRLIGGTSPSEGRVEVFYSGVWGTVCNSQWDHRDGDVVCRQLGYLRALQVEGRAAFGEGAGQVWLETLRCTGEEGNITLCAHSGWGVSSCGHSRDAGVTCTDDPELAIRLVGSTNQSAGRVEILHNNTWGTICDNTWDLNDARVVCRHLGFSGALRASRGAEFGQADSRVPIWLDQIHCTGLEEGLDECPHGGYGVHLCVGGHSEDAGVVCEVDTTVPPVRLVGGATPSEGRVEIFINDQWGTVCDDYFTWYEGGVVCRQLNYTGIIRVAPRGEFGVGRGPIWLDNVYCPVGDESYITQCMHLEYGVHNCDHSEDVGVVCDTHHPGEEAAIRLAGGDGESNGRVEIFHAGEWGTVCDSNWGLEDAAVTCRQLGWPGAISAPGSALFGAGVGPIWLDNVQCNGTEERLEECGYNGWGNTPCYHSSDASVVCERSSLSNATGPQNFDVRLMNGPDQSSGILQIYFNGVWGTVCQEAFTDAAARVVCTQLGFEGGKTLLFSDFGFATGVVWLDDVNCSGTEENLDQCAHAPWGVHNCLPVHMLDVNIQCNAPSSAATTSTTSTKTDSTGMKTGRASTPQTTAILKPLHSYPAQPTDRTPVSTATPTATIIPAQPGIDTTLLAGIAIPIFIITLLVSLLATILFVLIAIARSNKRKLRVASVFFNPDSGTVRLLVRSYSQRSFSSSNSTPTHTRTTTNDEGELQESTSYGGGEVVKHTKLWTELEDEEPSDFKKDLESGNITAPQPPTEANVTSPCPTAEPNVYVELPLIQSHPTSVTNEAAVDEELRGEQSDKPGALDGQ